MTPPPKKRAKTGKTRHKSREELLGENRKLRERVRELKWRLDELNR